MIRRSSSFNPAIAAVVLLGFAVAATGPAVAASAAACSLASHGGVREDLGDVDGDSMSDPVVGLRSLGAVDVHLASGAQRITEAQITDTPSGKFGTAATVGYVDDDGCADLIVSAPGSGDAGGSVYVIPGSTGGPVAAEATRLRAPGGAGDSWGATLAYLALTDTLAVGAPSTPLARNDGGAVLLYPMDEDRKAGDPKVVVQGEDGVAGASEAGDAFGAALSGASAYVAYDRVAKEPVTQDSLLIGAPGEAIGTKAKAGAVTMLYLSAPDTFRSSSLNQGKRAESGDQFGFAVANNFQTSIVGVPGESTGKAIHTGEADFADTEPSSDGTISPRFIARGTVDQNTEFYAGVNETGDRFGSSVMAFRDSYRGTRFAIGSPYEDVGSVKDAGTVTVQTATGGPGGDGDGKGDGLTQGSEPIGGKAEKGDLFGGTLTPAVISGTEQAADADQDQRADSIVIGVPGEDVSGAGTDSGYVYRYSEFEPITMAVLLPFGGLKAGLAYGTVVGTTSGR